MSPTKPRSDATSTCPWCSAKVPATAVTCPSCGASLRNAADGDILGVTQVDPAATRPNRPKPRRLTAWLVGERTEDEESTLKVEPPSEEVRREMLRLQIAAMDAEIAAKEQRAAAERDLPPGAKDE